MLSANDAAQVYNRQRVDEAFIYLRFNITKQPYETVYVSDSIRGFGLEPESFADGTHSWQDILYYEDLPEVTAKLRSFLQSGTPFFRLAYRVTSRSGALLNAEDYRSVPRGENGEAAYMDAVIFFSARPEGLPGAEAVALGRKNLINDLLIRSLTEGGDSPFLRYLQDCGEALGFDRLSFFAINRSKEAAQLETQWCAPGIAKRGQFDILIRGFQEALHKKLISEGILCFQEEDLRKLLQGMFHDNNTRSAAITLVRREQNPVGVLLFEALRKPRIWDEEITGLLLRVSAMTHSALRHDRETRFLRSHLQAGQTVLDNLPACVYVTEPETNELVYVNRRFTEYFGGDCIGKPCWLVIWGGISQNCVSCINTECTESPAYREIYIDKIQKWMGATIRGAEWFDGRFVRIVTCLDITKEKTMAESAEQNNFIDTLTGLPNRAQCDKDVAGAIAEAQQTGKIGYVAFIDMDDFKVINEGYGFEYGDAVLVEFAQFLSDNFTPKHRVYRTGGDEFAILLDSSNPDNVQSIAQLLLDRSRKPWRPLGKLVYVTVSLGLVQYPGELSNPRDIIRNADLALYQAKRAGKNSFAFFSHTEGKNAVARVEMERLLRDAIADHFAGFMPYFQPIVHLQSRRISGAEALLRWRSESGKMIMPGEFIPLTEYLGLIIPIGEFIMEESARVCRYINENYRPDFSVNINVSVRQLMLEDFTERVDKTLSRTGVNYKNIVLEITEGIAVDDLERLCKICDTLRAKGLRFAMDDFGTGYSSLNNLRVIPLDSIKIDKSFIRDVSQGSYANSFIHLITDLGHSMNRTICMEGVETEDQLGYCIMTGVDLVQGFYYSPPVPQEQFIEILSKPLEK